MSRKKSNRTSLLIFLFCFLSIPYFFSISFSNENVVAQIEVDRDIQPNLPKSIIDNAQENPQLKINLQEGTIIEKAPSTETNKENSSTPIMVFPAPPVKIKKIKIIIDKKQWINRLMSGSIFVLQMMLTNLIISSTKGQIIFPAFDPLGGVSYKPASKKILDQIKSEGKKFLAFLTGIGQYGFDYFKRDFQSKDYFFLKVLSLILVQNIGSIMEKIGDLLGYKLELPGISQWDTVISLIYHLILISPMIILSTDFIKISDSEKEMIKNLPISLVFLQFFNGYFSMKSFIVLIALPIALFATKDKKTVNKLFGIIPSERFNFKKQTLMILAGLYSMSCEFIFDSKIEIGIFFSKLFSGIVFDALITWKKAPDLVLEVKKTL